MISHRYRCIFIHIPRTGGSSIEDVIWPQERTQADLWMGFASPNGNRYQTGGLQHLPARRVRELVGSAVFDAYFKFTFVRNPWDKAVSQYAYSRTRPDLRAFIGMRENDSFERYLDLIGSKPHVQWLAQNEFLTDERGNELVDFIGRFERLEHDAAKIFARLGVKADLPHVNAAPREKSTMDYYDERTRAAVASLYARDFELLGY